MWSTPSALSGSITAPGNGSAVCTGSEVVCTATGTDADTRFDPNGNPPYSYPPDTLKYTWSGGGSWKDGVNEGAAVTWIAPSTPDTYVITCTISDIGTIPEGEEGNRSDADAVRTVNVNVVKIDIKQDGSVITDTTHSEIVGKSINLSAQVRPSGLNCTYQWSVPGSKIKDYAADASTASVTQLSSTDLQQQNLSYYWVDGGDDYEGDGREVSCAVTVNETTTCSGKATFDVQRPTALISSTTGSVRLAAGPALTYGGPGITFSRTITEPAGFTGGSTQWVQVVSSTLRRRQHTSGTWYRLSGSNVQDTQHPNSRDASCSDSPTQGLSSSYPSTSACDYFYMYLEYIPAAGGIAVPLRRVYWYWNGYTHFGGGSWYLDSSGNNANPADVDWTTPPEWNANVTSLQWQQEP